MKNLKIKLQGCIIASCLMACTACNSYLDIVPDDGMPSLETAFALRSTAIRYLYTCYGFMPMEGDLDNDFGMMTGDELWSMYDRIATLGTWNGNLFNIARGFQNASSPYGNDWNDIYQGIRCCNILIEEIGKVPDLPEWERLQWIAEAKFLKAWYHFHLVRKWGPVPIIRENLPINANIDEVRVLRNPIDECFDYVILLLDEAMPDLPLKVNSRDELGRITKPIAAAVKAKVAVYAASPLFNNNDQQATLTNKDGTRLFASKPAEEVKARWDFAAIACSEAINICNEASITLFRHRSRVSLNDTIIRQLDLRNVTTEKWNDEIIWANTHTSLDGNERLQTVASPNLQANIYPDAFILRAGQIQPPLKIAEMFYTNHGIPIENDRDWNSIDPYSLRNGGDSERWYIRREYTTVRLNFDREPRFYAWLGFDGGIWYGQRVETNDPIPGDLFWIDCKAGGYQRKTSYETGPVTGYYVKKFIHYENRQTSATGYSCIRYPWTLFRLADLYLLYAEAINESEGPNGAHSSDMFRYIDSVRSRASLPEVKKAWDDYSDTPGKYNTYEGMKAIIHRERLIELAFEGQRFWDLRRWKEAAAEYEKGIYGFKVTGSRVEDYYQKLLLAEQRFALKDYFWPIATSLIEQNPNLVQNIGW